MLRQALHDGWTVRPVGDLTQVPTALQQTNIAATVPGCIHTDLLSAKLIPDPYLDRHEAALRWIGETDWEYRTAFEVDDSLTDEAYLDLVFDGLDTLATITLNGQRLGQSDDMHLPQRIAIKPWVRPGMNELVIRFASAARYLREMLEKRGSWPCTGNGTNPALPHYHLRKMACNFGWDWGPALVTCGIWKPVHLEAWSVSRVESVRPLVTQADATGATVQVHVQLTQSKHHGLVTVEALLAHGDQTRIACRQMVPAGENQVVLTLHVNKPELWWPRGYGRQPMYHLNLIVVDEARNELDHWFGRVGLRTVELDTQADDIGQRMIIKVNGKNIFAKGADWIPDDCFLPRAHAPTRLEQRLRQACDLNMNILRVWGGGVFECETFYDLCDELGIMVWQDFLFACAAYPEEPLRELVEKEARYHVARLSRHPSLVLWNGCNENVWGYREWFYENKPWMEYIGERSWGAGFYFDLLPKVVRELDPTRPYWPASPWSGDGNNYRNGRPPNIPTHGNMHVWSVWFGGNYDGYRKVSPRFCSEFGFQGPPTYATLKRAIKPEDLRFGSPAMEDHQKCPNGTQKIHQFASMWFDVPDHFDDQLYLYQLNQARALATGVEWFRSRHPVCMGLIYWQLNDCWPVTSWAAIDGDGRYKPLAYATKKFFAPRLLTIQPQSDQPQASLALYAHNDDDTLWQQALTVRRLDFTGKTLAQMQVTLDVPARSNRALHLPGELAQAGDPSFEMLLAETSGGSSAQRAWWYFEADKNLRYPQPKYKAELKVQGREHRLTIHAATLLRDLAVFPDRLHPDARIDDQLVTLLPGESVTFIIDSPQTLTLESLTQPPVLACVNPYGKPLAVSSS